MKKYFYADGQQQQGPFTLEELKTKGLSPDILVWFDGLENWQPAGEIEELAALFNRFTPPQAPVVPPPPSAPPPASQPANYGGGNYGATNYGNTGYGGTNYGTNPNILDQPSMPKPKDWLVESILTSIFCSLFGCLGILAVVGIVYASQVNSKYNAGDYQGALDASKNAALWTKIGFFSGLGLFLISMLINLASAL